MNESPKSSFHRSSRFVAIAAMTVLFAGCQEDHPFFQDTPKHTRVPVERLRSLEHLNVDTYKKPQQEQTTTTDQLRKRFDAMAKYDISIEDARASVLEHNLDLQVQLFGPTIAAQNISEEEARFESTFTTRVNVSDSDTPTASTLSSAQSRNFSVTPGVQVPLMTGGSINVALPMSQSRNNNSFSTLNPASTSDLELSISQPLLRGAGRRANTAGIRIAQYNQQVSEAQTKLEAIRQLAAIDRAYWRLYRVRKELEVAQQQYELAQAQYERAVRRVAAQTVAEIEVIRSEAGRAQRLESIIVAQNSILQAQREFKRILNLPGLTVDTNTIIQLTTEPDPVEYLFDRSDLVEKALATRMEMLQVELRLAADAATIGLEKNRALPLLSLDYTYRVNGLGGSTQDAFRTLERNNFEDWQLGLNLEVPLGNEAARSRVRRAILERLQRLATKDQQQLAIRQEVLNAIDELDTGWQRILAARQSTALSTRTLRAEERQFNVGLSTSTNVLDAAARLAESQVSEIRAITDYQTAQVDLAFSTGTLLGAAKVDWTPVPAPDPQIYQKSPEEKINDPSMKTIDQPVQPVPASSTDAVPVVPEPR
jgi:outer membrane protein